MSGRSTGTRLVLVLIMVWSGIIPSFSVEETLFSAWESEFRTIPAVLLTKLENFELKPQFSGRGEVRTGLLMFRSRQIEYSFILTGGVHWLSASSMEGGYSYNSITGTYGGLLIGTEGPLFPVETDRRLTWKASAGMIGEWARYRNTYSRFFFPAIRLEGGMAFRLYSSGRGDRELILNAGIPLEWNFRRDTVINLAAGLHVGVSFRIGGRQ